MCRFESSQERPQPHLRSLLALTKDWALDAFLPEQSKEQQDWLAERTLFEDKELRGELSELHVFEYLEQEVKRVAQLLNLPIRIMPSLLEYQARPQWVSDQRKESMGQIFETNLPNLKAWRKQRTGSATASSTSTAPDSSSPAFMAPQSPL